MTSLVKSEEREFRGRYVNSSNWNVACLLCFHLQSLLSTRSPYDEFHRLFKTVPMDQFPINGKLKFLLFSWWSYSTFIPGGRHSGAQVTEMIAGIFWVWSFRFRDLFGEDNLVNIFLVAWFKKGFMKVIASTALTILLIQSNPFNMDTERAIEGVHINGVSVLSRSNLEKV